MIKNILLPLVALPFALLPLSVFSDLSPLEESEMEQVSGKGISIDARIDFAQDTTHGYNDDWSLASTSARDDNWISYRRILVDGNGNRLTDTDGDGYINAFGGANVNKSDVHNGYNVVYKEARPDGGDYLIRKPYYVILGEITGGISFDNFQLDFVDKIALRKDIGNEDAVPKKAALKFTLPDKIVFHDFEIGGLYVSEDEYIDKPGYHPAGHAKAGEFYGDNKILGLRVDGPVYMPSATKAYVFVTSD